MTKTSSKPAAKGRGRRHTRQRQSGTNKPPSAWKLLVRKTLLNLEERLDALEELLGRPPTGGPK